MNCEAINNLISAYLDGELSKRETRRVHEHIGCCARCRNDVNELLQMRELLKSSAASAPTPGFWDDIFHQVRTQDVRHVSRPTRKSRIHVSVATGMGLATAAAILLIPRPLKQGAAPAIVLQPSALVSLHADLRTDIPLADSGSMRYIFTEARSSGGLSGSSLEVE